MIQEVKKAKFPDLRTNRAILFGTLFVKSWDINYTIVSMM